MILDEPRYNGLVDRVVADVAPALKRAIDDQRAAILATLGPITRFVAGRLWTAFLALAPILARVALDAALSKFGSMLISEVADLIFTHRERELAAKDFTRKEAPDGSPQGDRVPGL